MKHVACCREGLQLEDGCSRWRTSPSCSPTETPPWIELPSLSLAIETSEPFSLQPLHHPSFAPQSKRHFWCKLPMKFPQMQSAERLAHDLLSHFSSVCATPLPVRLCTDKCIWNMQRSSPSIKCTYNAPYETFVCVCLCASVCDCVTPRGMRKQVAVRCGEISLALPWEQGNTSNPHSGLLLSAPTGPLASYRPLPRLNQVLQPTFSSPGLVQAPRFLQHHHIFPQSPRLPSRF